MAASKSYFARSNYRFLPTDRAGPIIASDSMYELDESDVWNSGRSESPEFRRPVTNSRKKPAARRVDVGGGGGTASSLPVSVPDWSKTLKDDYRENNRRRGDSDDEFDEDGEDRVPPHEFLARQMARTRIASFSVHEGVGRTLKGRDLSRVRNAIWAKTGFQD